MTNKPIGAYRTEGRTGWAAYDKHGRAWSVDAATAEELESARCARNAKAGKPTS